MLRRMKRTRLTAVALLALGAAIWGACTAKQQNGQECLKNADCDSDRCIQYLCVDPNASRPTGGVTDSGTVVDTGAVVDAPKDSAPDAPADTGAADTGPPDTGAAMDTGSD